MPPAALHHLTKASPVSKNSCSSPGWMLLPVSENVERSISVLVTPRAVAPVALPGPQMFFRDPKLPALAVAVALGVLVAAVALLVGVEVPPPLLLRPQATSPPAPSTTATAASAVAR